MADPYKFYNAFKEAGYLIIPSYYDKEHDNHCKVCGWENREGYAQDCFRCYCKQLQCGKQNKTIRGLSVASMSIEDFIIFRAIAEHKTDGIDISVTIDEYAEEVKLRNAQRIADYQNKTRLQQQIDATLFD